jgi:hypothetical protein
MIMSSGNPPGMAYDNIDGLIAWMRKTQLPTYFGIRVRITSDRSVLDRPVTDMLVMRLFKKVIDIIVKLSSSRNPSLFDGHRADIS